MPFPMHEVTVVNRVQFLTGNRAAIQPSSDRNREARPERPRAALAVIGVVFALGLSMGFVAG